MSEALLWLAIGIGGVVAYVAVMGALWRVLKVDGRSVDLENHHVYFLPLLGWFAVALDFTSPFHLQRHSARAAFAVWWPVTLPIFAVFGATGILAYQFGRALYLPLRATFRLAAGQLATTPEPQEEP